MTSPARMLRSLYGLFNHYILSSSNSLKNSNSRYAFRALTFAGLFGISPAHADWLDDVWSDKHASRHGHPAITISAEHGITITLPEASVGQAKAAGLSQQQAAIAFLGRFGPEMCSKIVDLNENRPALSMKLVVQIERRLREASAETQQRLSEAIAEAEAQGQRLSRGADTVFEASPDEEVWTIDYVPTHRAQCVEPPEDEVAGRRASVRPLESLEHGI